jgi:Tfp pilus assembly protein PilF
LPVNQKKKEKKLNTFMSSFLNLNIQINKKMMNLTKAKTVLFWIRNSSICFLIFFNIAIFSQNQSSTSQTKKDSLSSEISEEDVVKTTNYYITRKEYNKASLFLSKCYTHFFSESLKVNWLYAHVLSLNGDKIQAADKFKKAISISPMDKNLQMDYARLLYEMGEIDKVVILMSKFMDTDSTNVEFLLMQANISFWKGNLNNSRKKIDKIQEIYPNTAITNSLTQQIKELTAFNIKTNFEYQTDSQPLDYFAEHIVLSKYKSRYLNAKLEISNYNFSPQKEQAFILKLSNQFYFDKLKLVANVTGGFYKNFSEKTDWIGGINITHKLRPNLSLNLGYSKESLLSALPSTAFNLTHQDVFGGIDYNNKLLIVHAGYKEQFFKDDNIIKSIGSWILSQPMKIRKFNFQFGYSYSYTDAKDILFFFDNQGLGVYDPYFTPKEQEIHSGLFIVNYKPTTKISFEAKVNYGFTATVRNPYPLQVTATSIEIGGFYDETFTPVELTGNIKYRFSNRLTAKITYTNQETFFYKRENINLGLNFNI